MQLVTAAAPPLPSPEFAVADMPAVATDPAHGGRNVIRRNGAVVGLQPSQIASAKTKAFIAVHGGTGAASARVREQVAVLTESVLGLWSAASHRAARPTLRTYTNRLSSG